MVLVLKKCEISQRSGPGITLDPKKTSDHRVRRNSILRLEKSQEMKKQKGQYGYRYLGPHTNPKSSLPKHGCAAAQFFDLKARDHYHKMCQTRRANA